MAEYTIVPRSEARARGHKKYFTGKPCVNGHISLRFTKEKSCCECKRIANATPKAVQRRAIYQAKEENKRRMRDRAMQYLYGISLEQYEEMLAAQNNCCAICSTALTRGKGPTGAMVDHCHTGGHVRGILCNRCNRGLGYFRDNNEFLLAAVAYLRRGLP